MFLLLYRIPPQAYAIVYLPILLSSDVGHLNCFWSVTVISVNSAAMRLCVASGTYVCTSVLGMCLAVRLLSHRIDIRSASADTTK